MKKRSDPRRAGELRQVAELVAQVLTGAGDYVPTISDDPAMADAFDAAMAAAGDKRRAWRGTGKGPGRAGRDGGTLGAVVVVGIAGALAWAALRTRSGVPA